MKNATAENPVRQVAPAHGLRVDPVALFYMHMAETARKYDTRLLFKYFVQQRLACQARARRGELFS